MQSMLRELEATRNRIHSFEIHLERDPMLTVLPRFETMQLNVVIRIPSVRVGQSVSGKHCQIVYFTRRLGAVSSPMMGHIMRICRHRGPSWRVGDRSKTSSTGIGLPNSSNESQLAIPSLLIHIF